MVILHAALPLVIDSTLQGPESQEESNGFVLINPDTEGITHEQMSSPTQEQVASLTHKQMSSPTEEQVSSPTQEQVSSPTQEQVASLTHKQVSSSTQEQVASLTHKHVSFPTQEQVSSPTQEQVSSLTHKQVSSPTQEQVSSPKHKQVSCPTNMQVSSPTHKEVSSPTHEQGSSSTHAQVIKIPCKMNDQMKRAPNRIENEHRIELTEKPDKLTDVVPCPMKNITATPVKTEHIQAGGLNESRYPQVPACVPCDLTVHGKDAKVSANLSSSDDIATQVGRRTSGEEAMNPKTASALHTSRMACDSTLADACLVSDKEGSSSQNTDHIQASGLKKSRCQQVPACVSYDPSVHAKDAKVSAPLSSSDDITTQVGKRTSGDSFRDTSEEKGTTEPLEGGLDQAARKDPNDRSLPSVREHCRMPSHSSSNAPLELPNTAGDKQIDSEPAALIPEMRTDGNQAAFESHSGLEIAQNLTKMTGVSSDFNHMSGANVSATTLSDEKAVDEPPCVTSEEKNVTILSQDHLEQTGADDQKGQLSSSDEPPCVTSEEENLPRLSQDHLEQAGADDQKGQLPSSEVSKVCTESTIRISQVSVSGSPGQDDGSLLKLVKELYDKLEEANNKAIAEKADAENMRQLNEKLQEDKAEAMMDADNMRKLNEKLEKEKAKAIADEEKTRQRLQMAGTKIKEKEMEWNAKELNMSKKIADLELDSNEKLKANMESESRHRKDLLRTFERIKGLSAMNEQQFLECNSKVKMLQQMLESQLKEQQLLQEKSERYAAELAFIATLLGPPAKLFGRLPENHSIGIGSIVVWAGNSGVVKWIGSDLNSPQPTTFLAALELDEPHRLPESCSDGEYREAQPFHSRLKNILFCKLDDCKVDMRFIEIHDRYIEERMIPPAMRSVVEPQSVKPGQVHLGLWKGIQGDRNSCYMDVTLFSLFAFNSAFDECLKKRQQATEDAELTDNILNILNENIVNPLRKHGVVAARSVEILRNELDRLGLMKGVKNLEKDPEEFIKLLLESVFRLEPLIHLSNGLSASTLDLISQKKDGLYFPTVQTLLELTLVEERIHFKKVPFCLILHIPRFGTSNKPYERTFPNEEIDITNFVEGCQRLCGYCKSKAEFECPECFASGLSFSESLFCGKCKKEKHKEKNSHALRTTQSGKNPAKLKLRLSSALCIETSHYVSFTRTGSQQQPWVFFDSMSQRKDNINVPEVKPVEHLPRTLADYESMRSKPSAAVALMDRLYKDIYTCFYNLV